MVILERLRDIQDEIAYRYWRHYPEFREYAPLTLSAAFVLVLATMISAAMLFGANEASKPTASTTIEYAPFGAELRLSRIARDDAPAAQPRTPAPEEDATEPGGPMLIDIDPESGALQASAGTIEVDGTPIDIGSWPLD